MFVSSHSAPQCRVCIVLLEVFLFLLSHPVPHSCNPCTTAVVLWLPAADRRPAGRSSREAAVVGDGGGEGARTGIQGTRTTPAVRKEPGAPCGVACFPGGVESGVLHPTVGMLWCLLSINPVPFLRDACSQGEFVGGTPRHPLLRHVESVWRAAATRPPSHLPCRSLPTNATTPLSPLKRRAPTGATSTSSSRRCFRACWGERPTLTKHRGKCPRPFGETSSKPPRYCMEYVLVAPRSREIRRNI